LAHASNLKVEFGLSSPYSYKKDTVAGQLVLLPCAPLLTIRVILKQPPGHQNLFSSSSLVTHQKAQLFLLPSPIASASIVVLLSSLSLCGILAVFLSRSVTRGRKDLQEIRSWRMDQNELWAVECRNAPVLENRHSPVINRLEQKRAAIIEEQSTKY
jgi:hypothetical protein